MDVFETSNSFTGKAFLALTFISCWCWYSFFTMSEGIHFRRVFANRVCFVEHCWQLAVNAESCRPYWHAKQCCHQNLSLFQDSDRTYFDEVWHIINIIQRATFQLEFCWRKLLYSSLSWVSQENKCALNANRMNFPFIGITLKEVCIEDQQNVLRFHKSEERDLRDTAVHVITWWDSLM